MRKWMNTAGFASQDPLGALAQMGERLICIQEVSGSIPLGSTKTPRHDDLIAKCKHAFSRPIGRIDIVKRDTISTMFGYPE